MQRAWAWIETVLRRYPWAIALAVLIPCAYFAASGTNNLLALLLFKADVTALTRPAPPSPADALAALSSANTTSHHSRDTHQMLARDVFDADAGCLNCAPPPTATAEGGAVEAGEATPMSGEPVPCDGQAKVTGAVEVDDPLWSFVFISPGGTQPALPYRVGQTVDGKTVASIGWHERYGAFAMLRAGPGGPQCFYAQIMPPRTAPPPPPAAPASTGSPGGDALAAALDHGISQTAPNEYSVQRSLIDRILENQAELMRTTRIMPHEEGGHVVGVQLFGVRGNSLLGRLGLQNNDVLNRINGLDISSPDRALEAYSRLRTADRITLSVTRNGTPQNIDFNIH